MKNFFLISAIILLVSCAKNEYKVNLTFSYYNQQIDKTLRLRFPINMYVLAEDSIELENVIKDTLLKAYDFMAQDIKINSITIEKNVNNTNAETLYFSLPSDVSESFLDKFSKKYVLKGNLTRIDKNYSPNQIYNSIINEAYLVVNNQRVKLIDYTGNSLLEFEFKSLNKLDTENKSDNFDTSFFKSVQYIQSIRQSQKYYLVHNYLLEFNGVNSKHKKMKVTFDIQDNSGASNELFVNTFTVTYSENNINYIWLLKNEWK